MLLICWKFTQKSCWLLNHVIYWHRCRAFQHLSPKVHRQKRFSLFKQRHCLPLSCQMALVLVLLFISGSLNGIETKNCFDLNVQARFEIPKGLYCVGDPSKRYSVELELKIKFSAESWGEIRPNFKRLVYYACRTKFLFWWPITLQNCKPLISKWMISNKTHLEKRKKREISF